jgi:hypothetical protein
LRAEAEAAAADFSSRMELVADAPGSKRSRSERMPRTTMVSSVASSHAAASADASDAVERLSEQQ